MAEPLSSARIEHIRALLRAPDVGGVSERIARELLVEVDRLREEDAMVTAMREYTATLKRGVLWALFCLASGLIAWAISSHLVRQPWTGPLTLVIGGVIGAVGATCVAWAEDRREARQQ